MDTILFTELRDGDRFQFEDHGSVYEYRGSGWFNIPYSGGPWHISNSKGCLKEHGRVILISQADRESRRAASMTARELHDLPLLSR